jgi:hypothetical protein
MAESVPKLPYRSPRDEPKPVSTFHVFVGLFFLAMSVVVIIAFLFALGLIFLVEIGPAETSHGGLLAVTLGVATVLLVVAMVRQALQHFRSPKLRPHS